MKAVCVSAVVAIAAACAAPAMAQDANQADLECATLMAYAVNGMEDNNPAFAGMAGGMMYYIGRLEGRAPTVDWVARATNYVSFATADDVIAQAGRCAAEYEASADRFGDFTDAVSVLNSQ